MKTVLRFWAMVFLGSFLSINSSYANYMECGVHLISDSGSHRPGKYEVLKKCGEPTERYGDVWVYDKSGYQTRTLHFDGAGHLQRIED